MSVIKAQDLFGATGNVAERLLWQDYWQQPDDQKLRDQLVEYYSPFARKISLSLAISFRSLGVTPEDCFHSALVGLIEAIDRYKPGRAQFRTYAAYRVRGAVLNGISVYSEQLDMMSRNRAAQAERVASIKRGPKSSDDPFEQVVDATLNIAISVLLDELTEECEEPEPQQHPYPAQEAYALSQQLFEAAMTLPEREAVIIYYHYFLDYRFNEIAVHLGVSKGRVSQLHARALTMIRERYELPAGFDLTT